MVMDLKWIELTSPDLEQPPILAVIPIGSIEIHGPHLPLGIDTMVIERVAVEAVRNLDAVVLPPLPYAYVPENRHFKGTISLSADTFLRLLEEVCDEVYRNGVEKIVVLNGHGGNIRPLRLFIREVLSKKKKYCVYLIPEPWGLITDVIEEVKETDEIGHACEIETSIALYLFPGLCRLYKVKRPATTGRKPPRGVETAVDWSGYAVEGYLGDPRKASSKKDEGFSRPGYPV